LEGQINGEILLPESILSKKKPKNRYHKNAASLIFRATDLPYPSSLIPKEEKLERVLQGVRFGWTRSELQFLIFTNFG
jgi:hypothetical protein